MAIPIRSIPILEGKDAKRFNEKADKAFKKGATVDFGKQAEIARAILKKANML